MAPNASPTLDKGRDSFPGIGTIIWLSLIVCSAFLNSYISVCNEAIIFLIAACFIWSIPIIVTLFVVVPLSLLVIAAKRFRRGHRRAAVAFAAAPLIAFATFVMLTHSFEWLLLKYEIAGYEREIEAAVKAGKNVRTRDVEINLGPPVTAAFSIRQMLWSDNAIVYNDSDKVNTAVDENCQRSFHSLGGHFYWRSGIC